MQTTDDGLVYEVSGSGPDIIAVHGGLGLDRQYLRPLVDELSSFARVTTFDVRGNGASTAPDDWGDITLASLADDIDSIAAAVGAASPIVFGHSYGGFIAMVYATRHPDRLDGLILGSTAPHVRNPPNIADDAPAEALEAFGALFAGPMPDDATWAETWSAALPLYAPDLTEQQRAQALGGTTYRAAAWNRAAELLADYDVSEHLMKITVPTLLLAGADDFLTGVAGHQEILGRVPEGEMVVFDGCGHFPFVGRASDYSRVISSWLERHHLA